MTDIKRKIWTLIRGGSFRGYLRTMSGYPLTLTDCMADKPVSLAVYGNTVQDGTPSPDNPVEVQGCGERTANLLNIREYEFEFGSIDGGNGVETSLTDRIRTKNYIPITPGTYTLSRSVSISVAIRLYDDGKKFISNSAAGISISWLSGLPLTFTLPSNVAYMRLVFFASDLTADLPFQLEQGDTATPYEPYGYKVPVRFGGRNLFDRDNAPIITGAVSSSTLIFTDMNGGKYTYFQCQPNTTYTITKLPQSGVYCTADTPPVPGAKCNTRILSTGNDGITTSKATITTGDNDAYIWIAIIPTTGGDYTAEEMVNSIQLEQGSTAPPYEPYREPQTYPIYLDATLYGNGGAADTVELDVEHKTATLTRRFREYIFTGGETVNIEKNEGYPGGQRFAIPLQLDLQPLRHTVICNRFRKHDDNSNTDNTIFAYATRVFIYCSNITTADELKAFLADNKTIALLPYATPITTDISDKIDWDSIPKLWRGTVIVTADTTAPPSNITSTYYADKPGGGD